jgi:hypothetical protein
LPGRGLDEGSQVTAVTGFMGSAGMPCPLTEPAGHRTRQGRVHGPVSRRAAACSPQARPAILAGLEPDAGPAAVPCCSPAQRERQPDLIHNGPAEFRLSVHGGGSGIRCRGPPEAHDCRSSRYGSRSCHRCRLRSVASRNLAHAPDRRLRTAAAGTFPHFSNRRSSILALASCQTIAGL